MDGRKAFLAEGPAWAKARRAKQRSVRGTARVCFQGVSMVVSMGAGLVC